MKYIIACLIMALPVLSYSQDSTDTTPSTFSKIISNLSGSYEGNLQWYVNDKILGDFDDPVSEFDIRNEHIRANQYLRLDYSFSENFTAGVQVESYEPLPLLNYAPLYNDTNLGTYYVNFRNDKIDITAGHFYEQFGSGILLRAFEERQLGLNNALRGGRIKYSPTDFLNLVALYGQTRIGFKTSNSNVFGFDSAINLASAFNIEGLSGFNLGLSYVGKQEDFTPPEPQFDGDPEFNTDGFPEMVNSYAVRADIDFGKFYANAEYSLKGEDITYSPASLGATEIIEGKYFDGSALLFTLGYSQKGLGISSTFRRMENMTSFSERDFANPAGEFSAYNLLSMNYVPALTKQQDYSLTNIYVSNPQPLLSIASFAGQAGEIGNQFDIFYTFKKGSSLGGKYGTKLAVNMAYWALLDATFDQDNITYDAEFLKFGKRLNRDISFEMRKKWSKTWSSIFTFQDNIIDKGITDGSPLGFSDIKSKVAIAESTYKIGGGKSVRLEAQHLWTKEDDKNWVGGTLEFNLSRRLSMYVTDIYNYGNDDEEMQLHYYNVGGSFTKGATRIALNYGRQRGGLVCVGGVCRIVPENTGLTLNLNTSF